MSKNKKDQREPATEKEPYRKPKVEVDKSEGLRRQVFAGCCSDSGCAPGTQFTNPSGVGSN